MFVLFRRSILQGVGLLKFLFHFLFFFFVSRKSGVVTFLFLMKMVMKPGPSLSKAFLRAPFYCPFTVHYIGRKGKKYDLSN